MKKLLFLILIFMLNFQSGYAADAAYIHIKISGASADNRYFLCLANIGCLSIHAAERGKIYPIFHSFKMNEIFITDTDRSFRVYPEGLPPSCNLRVETSQTITIYGSIKKTSYGVRIHQLRCEVR